MHVIRVGREVPHSACRRVSDLPNARQMLIVLISTQRPPARDMGAAGSAVSTDRQSYPHPRGASSRVAAGTSRVLGRFGQQDMVTAVQFTVPVPRLTYAWPGLPHRGVVPLQMVRTRLLYTTFCWA